jgi:hypothetical protein
MIQNIQMIGCTANPKAVSALAKNDGTVETVTFQFNICGTPASASATFGPAPSDQKVVKAAHSVSGTCLVTVTGGGKSDSMVLNLDTCS